MSSSRKMLKIIAMVSAITGLAMLTFGLAVAGAGLFGGTAISGTDAASLYMGVSGVSGLCGDGPHGHARVERAVA